MDPVDQNPLVVGLEEIDVHADLTADRSAETLDIAHGPRSVVSGFAGTQQVQVGPVEYEDGRHG
jgi:hypothetical protein